MCGEEGGIPSSSPSPLPRAAAAAVVDAGARVGAVESFLEGISSEATSGPRSLGASVKGAVRSRSAMGTSGPVQGEGAARVAARHARARRVRVVVACGNSQKTIM